MKDYATVLESYLVPVDEAFNPREKLKKFGEKIRVKYTNVQMKALFKILDKLNVEYDPKNFKFPIISEKTLKENKRKLSPGEMSYLAQMSQSFMNQVDQTNQQTLMQIQLQNQLFQDQLIQNQMMQNVMNQQTMQNTLSMHHGFSGGGFGGF